MNTTTPMPSLNSDSPASVAFIVGGTRTDSKMPSTATGSVGLIRAPNTSAQTNGIGWPARSAMIQMPPATSPVDSSVPRVASALTVRHRRRNADRSTCSAPANSRKLSMPCISVSWKSIRISTPEIASSTFAVCNTDSTSSSATEAASAMSTRPMVGGACRYRWFR